MEIPESGRLEKEMAALSSLADQVKDQTLPLEQLAPLVDKALAKAAVCDQLLKQEEDKVAASFLKHQELLKRMRVPRYLSI